MAQAPTPWTTCRRAVALLAFLLALPAAAGEMPPAVLAALQARRAAVLEAYNAGDIDALVACYTADAWHLTPRRPPAQGRDALARFFAPAMPLYTLRAETRVLDADLDGDTATVVSESTLSGEPRPGAARDGRAPPPFAEQRLNLTVFRRQPDGRWLIHRFVDTTPAEAPPAPGATPLK